MQIDTDKPQTQQVEPSITAERLTELRAAIADSDLAADEKQVFFELIDTNPALAISHLPGMWRYAKPAVPPPRPPR